MDENNCGYGLEAQGTPAKTRNGKHRWILLLCGGLLAAALVGAVCFFLLSGKKTTPLQKTLLAVLSDDAVPLDQVKGDSGRFVLTLGKDLLGRTLREPLILEGHTVRSGKKQGVSICFGTKDQKLSGQLLSEGRELWVASEDLFGDTAYRVTLSEELLRASFLNPANGGEYALPQSLFDSLCKAVKALETEEADGADDADPGSLTASAGRLRAVLLENLKTVKSKDTVTLLDGDHVCRTVTYTLDHEAITALAVALKKELEVYRLAEHLAEAYPNITVNGASDGETLGAELTALVNRILEDETVRFHFSVSYAVLDGYFVSGEILLTATDRESEAVPDVFSGKVCFASEPAKDRRAELSLNLTLDGKKAGSLFLSYSNEEAGTSGCKEALQADVDINKTDENGNRICNRFRLTYRAERDDDGAFLADAECAAGYVSGGKEQLHPLAKLHAAGTETWEKSEKRLSVAFTALSLTSVGNGEEKKLFEMTDSVIRFEFGGRAEKVRLGKSEELTSLKASDVKAIGDAVRLRAEEPFAKIAEASGVIKRTRRFAEVADIPLDRVSDADRVAWDRTTNRIYVAGTAGVRRSELRAYDALSGALIGKRDIGGVIASIDADGGYVAYTKKEQPFRAYVANGETLETEHTVTPEIRIGSNAGDYLKNVILDGKYLICTTEDQWVELVVSEWETGQCEVLHARSHEGVMAYDREHRVYALLEQGISRTDMVLFSLGQGTQKSVSVIDSYATGGIYFNGTAFQACGLYFSSDGEKMKAGALTKNRRYDSDVRDYGIVYCDSDFLLLMNQYKNGLSGNAGYTADGTPLILPADLLAKRCLGRAGDYLVMVSVPEAQSAGDGASPASVVVCRAEDAWMLVTS